MNIIFIAFHTTCFNLFCRQNIFYCLHMHYFIMWLIFCKKKEKFCWNILGGLWILVIDKGCTSSKFPAQGSFEQIFFHVCVSVCRKQRSSSRVVKPHIAHSEIGDAFVSHLIFYFHSLLKSYSIPRIVFNFSVACDETYMCVHISGTVLTDLDQN